MGIITCAGITKRFGNYTALNAIDLDIPEGGIFGLLGPNGAGKTTMIRIINRITLPDEGKLLFKGKPMQASDIESIGYLPEERGLYKKMKVGDQALYLSRLKGMGSAEANRELRRWFEKFGIQAWWNKKVEELSKGMAQKVQFIITVLHNPSLLILDEPFSGFDPVNVQLIRDEILRLKKNGTTIILSTHNMESVEELCDHIALINKSNLILSGNTDEIRRRYGNNQVEVLYRPDGSRTSPVPDFSPERHSALSAEVPSGILSGPFAVVSDLPHKQYRRAVLEVSRSVSNAQVLESLIRQADVVSYQELIPRMNDIFIKLVKGE